jgi:hypothetical protein
MSLVQPSEKMTLQTGEIFASSMTTLHHKPSKHHKFVRTNNDTIEEEVRRTIKEEVLPWETLEVRLSNR